MNPHGKSGWNILLRIIGSACVCLAVAGCGASGPEMARVRGTVSYQGKPLTKGTITFVSTDEKRPNATSAIGADGSFDLQTVEPGDGAQLGDYVVTVSGIGTDEILDYIPKKPVENKSPIPLKYGAVDTSGLKQTVKSGRNHFDIKLD